MSLCLLCVVGAVAFLVVATTFSKALSWAEGQLPKLDNITASLNVEPSVIVASDGTVLYRAIAEYRRPVTFDEIPPVVRNAVLAAEDHRFFEHRGVDYISAIRAVLTNVREGQMAEGASTITMQLAKRLYTSPEKTLERKMRDAALALQIERRKSKNEILRLYMNQVYFGNRAYGIKAAAEVYFGKSLDQLTISDSALLAGMLQRPSRTNPYRNYEAAIARRNVVLRRMLDEGMISEAEHAAAVAEEPVLRERRFESGARHLRAPYFVDYVLGVLEEELPGIDLLSGGYRIETTLVVRAQEAAERAVKSVVEENRRRGVSTGAFMLMNAQGEIKAMVGGVDYGRNQFNVITQGRRQPGSAFKPMVYATALSTGAITINSSISNQQLTITDSRGRTRLWPRNANNKYSDAVSVRTAMAASINVPAVRINEKVGPRTVANYSRDVFGIRSELDPVLPLALGSSAVRPIELAEAYSVFMLEGDRVRPFGVRKIVGPDGQTIRSFAPRTFRAVLDRRVARDVDSLLRAVVTSGTGRSAASIKDARGKTGTTSDNRDAWFVGYTNSLLGVGWIGNEQRVGNRWVYNEMPRVFGGTVTIQIWVRAMRVAQEVLGDEPVRQRGEDILFEPLVDQPADEIPVDNRPTADPDPEPAEPARPIEADPVPPTPSEPPAALPGRAVPPRPSPSAPADGETVQVEICVDSGQRANMYCPETVKRSFPKGTEPRRTCPLHGP
ncbi:MAG: PBP1A family penicillin-binding protein [Fimbriimonadaceae bacterium]